MPRRRTKSTKRNPLLDMPVDQTWNTRGSVVWSNKIVVCPRCGKESRLTLAASLRSDWDLSLTCCPLPISHRRPSAAEDVPPDELPPNGSEAPLADPSISAVASDPPPADAAESPDSCESNEGSETPPPTQYRRCDEPHDIPNGDEALPE